MMNINKKFEDNIVLFSNKNVRGTSNTLEKKPVTRLTVNASGHCSI
jgi:hypothetical protein